MFKRIAIGSFLAVALLTTGCAAKKEEAPPPAATDDSARRAEEAPFEHVSRALQRLGVRQEPLERLTTLFAEARFSTHRITEQQREEAMACLQACLDDLGTVPCG